MSSAAPAAVKNGKLFAIAGVTAGKPKYRIEILPMPVGGAAENVMTKALIEYVLGDCSTPLIDTSMEEVLAGATVIVKATVVASPLK